jgi:hypothetical protein
MADENIDIEVTGFQSLKAQIKEAQIEYQKLLADVNATPSAINAAAQKAADLKDKFDDANDSVNALTGAGKFQAVTKGLTALSGGFTALQGAISLAGGDAKDFEKTFQKVQGAMALTQGLTALEDLGNAFGNLKKVAVTAFNAIKTAIGSTGIGLLVIALGAIYAYWDDIKAVVSGVDEEQKKLNADSAANLAMQEKQLAAISAQENILRLQGKTEEEIYQLKLDQYDAVIKAAKANLVNLEVTEKKQIEAAQRNKDILQGIIRFLTIPLTLLLKTVDLVGEALGQDFGLEEKFSGGLASLVFDPAAIKKEGDKAIEEAKTALTKLENERAGMILQHDAKRDAEQKVREQKAKEAREKEEGLQKTHLEKTRDIQDKYGELMIDDENDRTLRTLENKQKKERDELQLLITGYTTRKKLTKSEEETLRILRAEYDALLLLQKKETADKEEELETKKIEKLKTLQKAYLDYTAVSDAKKKNQEILAADERKAAALKALNENIEIAKKEGKDVGDVNKFFQQEQRDITTAHISELNDIELKYQVKKKDDYIKASDEYLVLQKQYLDSERDKALHGKERTLGSILTAQYNYNKKINAAELENISRRLKALEGLNSTILGLDKKLKEDQAALDAELAKGQDERDQEKIDKLKLSIKAELDAIEKGKSERAKLAKEIDEAEAEYATKKSERALFTEEKIQGYLQTTTALVNTLADYQKMQNQIALEDTKAKFDNEAKLLKDQYDRDIAQADLTAEQKETIETDYANASNEIEFNRATENYKREKEGFDNGKKVQYAQAVIAGIQGAMGAFSALAPIPVVGPALGAIAAAAVAVSTAFQLATISKTTYSGVPPVKPKKVEAGGGAGGGGGSGSSGSKRAQGGLLTGRRHSEGGIPTSLGELEGGEYVVNRQATESFLPLLEQINGMGKGSGAPNNLSVTGEQNINGPTPIIKTYVVASDMTSQQEANKRLEDIARL